jgi:tetratricopeptide (TPR) repeat protein
MTSPLAHISKVVAAGEDGLDRATAARLLRDARRGVDETVDWAFSMMPDSPGARRLKIKQLLHHGDTESADALIAHGLLQRPTNASLCLLRARSLFAQQKLNAANHELRLVLDHRPKHAGALELAGHIAARLGEARRAVLLLERAEWRRPDDAIRRRLAEAWLQVGRPRMARQAIGRMAAPTVLLRAQVLRAERRLLEARELLEDAARDLSAADHDEILITLIDVLEEASDLQRLRRTLVPVDTTRPAVLARAGLAWLAMGAFHVAAVRMAKLARVPGFRAEALAVLMVASTMVNRPALARRALQRLRRIEEPIDRTAVAEAWARGLLGQVLLDQCSARKAGADPHTGRLQQLLADAASAFETPGEGPPLSRQERRDLQRHLAVCHQLSAPADEGPADTPTPYSTGVAA